MNDMQIAGRKIGKNFPPYIIAEMSANHNGSLQRALDIILAAKTAGADAVKLQTYTAETMTLNVDHPRFRVKGNNPWDGEHLFDLYEKAATPWEWHEQLFNYAKEIGITIFSSPFDSTAVKLLESLNAPAYKIASFELVDHDLIRCCAQTGKPLIMSTGMASIIEISEAVDVAREAGAENLVLLKCTSSYPAPYETMNLNTIKNLAETFSVQSGLSDHSIGTAVPVAATALGAAIIEKHVTVSRDDGGVDSSFSMEPHELAQLVEDTRNAHLALGNVTYVKGDEETSFKKYRRSLFIIRALPKGHILTVDDVAALRPGDGLAPKYKNSVLGRALCKDVSRGTPVLWDILT
jgi:pseudaminic acid synthase